MPIHVIPARQCTQRNINRANSMTRLLLRPQSMIFQANSENAWRLYIRGRSILSRKNRHRRGARHDLRGRVTELARRFDVGLTAPVIYAIFPARFLAGARSISDSKK